MVPVLNVDQQVIELLPGDERTVNSIVLAQSLADDNKQLNRRFQYFMNGSTDFGYWDVTVTYSKGDLVRMLDGEYESLANANLANPTTDSAWWVKVLDSFIGVSESTKFSGKYLNLTWALNRIFGTTFRQPPYPSPYGGSGTFSDIYVTNRDIVRTSFVMYPTAAASSKMYPTFSTGFMFNPPAYAGASTFYFYINVPTAVFNALGASADIREATLRSYVDRLVPAGLVYGILTY
jgi:hypothetical protein